MRLMALVAAALVAGIVSAADGYRLHVWVELIGFDCAAEDCGVDAYLDRIGRKPEAVSFLFTTNRLFRNHRGLDEDYPIPAWACSYFGREHNPERMRQGWTAFRLRRLVKSLRDRGVEVYASFFNLFERMPMADERLEEELAALVPFLTDFGFSGFHAADGYAPPSHVLDACADADRPRLARANAVRFAANLKRMADVLHAKGLKVFANSTWTRDPYESLFRYGVDYRLLAKTGIDGVYLESSGAAQRILGCNKGHTTLPLDRCRAMVMLAKAAMPGMPLVLLHAINDGQEQWSALRHAPAAAKSEALELGNVYCGNRRAIDGYLACLGDGLSAAEWKTLTDTWDLSFTPTTGPVGPRVVWSDRAFDAEFDACAVSRDASTYRLLSELIARGAPVNGVVSVEDALKDPSLPLLVLNPAYFPKEELAALRRRTAHVTEFGRGAETINRLPYVMITDEQRKFPGMPDVQYYWRQPLYENLPDPRDFNEIVAILNNEENAPYRVTSPDIRTWAVRLANGRLGVFARNGADTYAEACFNVVCNPAHVEVHTDFPAVPVSTTFRARIAPDETVLFSYEEAGLTPPNRPPHDSASGKQGSGR